MMLVGAFGLEVWFEKNWARWLGIGLAWASVGASIWSFWHDGFSVTMMAFALANLVCIGWCWRLPVGPGDKPAQDKGENK